jgi:hypothetical protein
LLEIGALFVYFEQSESFDDRLHAFGQIEAFPAQGHGWMFSSVRQLASSRVSFREYPHFVTTILPSFYSSLEDNPASAANRKGLGGHYFRQRPRPDCPKKSRTSSAGKWEFPGGKIENGETPEECLRQN